MTEYREFERNRRKRQVLTIYECLQWIGVGFVIGFAWLFLKWALS